MTTDAIATVPELDGEVPLPDPKDPARKPHRVLRQAIRARGEAAPRTLYWAFGLFNAAFFESRLATPLILIAPTSSPRAEGTYTARDIHGLESVIRIAPATMKKGLRAALACLLHECIHAWQHEVSDDLERGNRGHGLGFCAKANAIADALELPRALRVSPQGREKGTRRPEHWPELPRFEDDPIPPAKKRSKEREADADGDDDADGVDVAELAERVKQRERRCVLNLLEREIRNVLAHAKGKGGATVGTLREIHSIIESGAHESY